MSHSLLFCLKVPFIVLIVRDDKRNTFINDDIMFLKGLNFERIIRNEADRSYMESIKDFFDDGIFPIICWKSQLLIRINGIQSGILQCIHTNLIQESNISPFLSEVNKNSSGF